jgi:hypothetical protein
MAVFAMMNIIPFVKELCRKIFCFQPIFILHLQQEIEQWKGTGFVPFCFYRT